MSKSSRTLTNARKEEIISACKKLYETESFKDITIRDIGNATTFGRTSVYNYFRTKEEIFLAVLQKEYEAWTEELEALACSGKALSRDEFAAELACTLARRELLLKILSMNLYDMEENSGENALREFKTAYGGSINAVAACLKAYCPEMNEKDREEFIYAFFPFVYGIYPYTSVTDKQKTAMEKAGLAYAEQTVYGIAYNFLKKLIS